MSAADEQIDPNALILNRHRVTQVLSEAYPVPLKGYIKDWTDEKVAKATGLSATFVAKCRAETCGQAHVFERDAAIKKIEANTAAINKIVQVIELYEATVTSAKKDIAEIKASIDLIMSEIK